MRPHLLRFAGIGPYPQQVEINFDELSSLGLYLIVGPTGAGKTTIFDAITYALYGKLAGARSAQHIISDHDNAANSLVELEFTHRSRHYTVRRCPTPAGKSSKPNDHLLISHVSEGDPSREEVRVTGASRVTTEIEGILGLDASQFNRVMLLPQNEFQQFLLANSSDKEKLLRSLFDTDLFHRAGEEIDKAAKRLETQADESTRNLELVASQIEGERSRLVAAGLLPDHNASNNASEEVSEDIAEPSTDVMLKILRGHIQTALSLALSQSSALNEAAQKAMEKRIEAATEAQRFTAAQELATLRAAADQEEDALQQAAALLQLHSQAGPIADEITRRDTAALKLQEATELLRRVQLEAQAVLTAVSWKHPALAQLHDAIAELSTSQVGAAFQQLSTTVSDSEKHHVAADLALTKSQECRTDFERITAEIPSVTNELDQATNDLAAAKQRVAVAQTAVLRLSELYEALQNLKKAEAEADIVAPTRALQIAETAHLSALEAATIAQEALSRGLAIRTRHLAAELAQDLNAGTPCPVCGSEEHPTPAPISDDAPDLDALTRARDDAHHLRLTAEGVLAECQEALATAQLAAQQLPSTETRGQIRNEYNEANQHSQQISELNSLVDHLTERRHDLQTQIAAMNSTAATAQTEAERYRKEAAAEISQAEVAAEILPMAQELLDQIAPIVRQIEDLGTELSRQQPVVTHTSQQVSELLATSDFPDEDSVFAAVIDQRRREELTQLQADAALRTQTMNRLEGTIGNRPPPASAPDVELLLETEESLHKEAHFASEVATKLDVASTRCADLAKALEQIGPEATKLQERSARFREISNIIRNGKKPHFALERWVQRAIFEDVCQVASERIKVLSSGRYLLTLDTELGRQKSHAGGLDLYVTDSHTGRTRPVQTLSGGEQFLTSLALALALADVVQQVSGGIELASLFIDEGFGSLDGETLDTAVEVLRSLQDAGRSVGVISHVEAMQNDLPVGVRVIPAPAGSSILFPALTRR